MARSRLLLVLLSLLAAPALAQPCAWTISPQQNQTVYDRLRALPDTGEHCVLDAQSAQRNAIIQRWLHNGVQLDVTWAPRACQGGTDARIVPENLRPLMTACPRLAAAVQTVADARDWPQADKPEQRENPRQFGQDYQLVQATAMLEGALAFALLLWLLLALRRARQPDLQPWWRAGAAVTLLALVVRFLVPPALSNWFTPTLALTEIPRAEFYGPGHVALQWLLRSVLPWSDRLIFAANQLLGALVVPLWLIVLFQRGVALRTALLAAGFVAVLPLHARLSASASEHVLAAFTWMAALAAWQASVRAEVWLPRLSLGLLAVGLALLTALTRIDTTPLVALLALWVLPPVLTAGPPPLRRRVVAALLWLVVFALVVALLLPLLQTMVQDRGRPLPTWHDRTQALYDVPAGLGRLFFTLPGWIGPLVGTLALVGLIIGRAPWLALLAVISLLAVPLGIGRSPFDFIMMRYYLPVLPVLTLPAALALERLPTRRWLIPVLLLGVVLLGWPAWRAHYGFADEYTWLRSRLSVERHACTVAQVPVSNTGRPNSDVDCCLDLARCPLVAALPTTTFAVANSPEALLALPGDCLYYYEGTACGLQPTPELLRRRPAEFKQLQATCEAMRQTPGLMLGGEAEVAPLSHFDAFGDQPVHVRLWRVERNR